VSTSHGRGLRVVVAALLGVAVIGFVLANRHDIPDAARALRHVRLAWLAVGIATSLAYLTAYSLARGAALASFGVPMKTRRALLTGLVAHSANIVAKTGGMAAVAVYRDEARRSNHSPSRVVGGVMLTVVLGDLAFAAVLLCSLVVLAANGRFTTGDAIAAGVFAVYLGIVVGAVVAAARSRSAIRQLFAIPARVRRHQPDPTHADELFDAIQQVRRQPRATLPTIAWMLSIEAIGVLLLWECLRAYGQHTGISVPLVGYAISVLFSIIGVLPAGIGFAEASLGAVLVSFSVPGPTAAVVVITYRVLEVWLPLVLGLIVMRRWRRHGAAPAAVIG
jgi:uncharacterized protein (TIRG00374 family)